MPVSFPHSGRHTVSDRDFLCAWHLWFTRFGPAGANPATDPMPRSNRAVTFPNLVAATGWFSLDVLCRVLTPRRNTMQATDPFMAANAHLLQRVRCVNPRAGTTVNGAQLTPYAVRLLTGTTITACPEIEALLEADFQDEKGDLLDAVVPEDTNAPAIRPACTTTPHVPGSGLTLVTLVNALVDWIDADPFQPHYRRRPAGAPVVGWRARLHSYFWPSPSLGLGATTAALAPFVHQAGLLMPAVRAGTPWTAAQQQSAVTLTHDICRWGGVPKGTVHPADVRAVFESAASGTHHPLAPMDSGWTKVAAIASTHLPAHQHLVIWDSRVAHALIRRLDCILHLAGHSTIPAVLANIGKVPGRGGTRVHATYHLPWPNGYRSWLTQFAGSALIREIRDELNRREIPTQTGTVPPWSCREVEMVLFMDGY